MDYTFVDLRTMPFDRIIDFYEKNTSVPANWHRQKLADHYRSGKLLGCLCVDAGSQEILGAYLGLDQPLLCNPRLKAIQSIDTLVSPQARGGSLLRLIGEAFYRDLSKRGYDCVYGLPTSRSEPLRERALGWNKARTTYRYVVPVPTLLLKIVHLALPAPTVPASRRDKAELGALAGRFGSDARYTCHDQPGLFFISYRSGMFAKLGLVRSRRHMGFWDRLRTLCRVAASAQGWFLLTYATEDSETARLFSSFSLRKRTLNFAGRLLSPDSRVSFGETSFEYIEFDTFGLT
jgi:hypothetical protein